MSIDTPMPKLMVYLSKDVVKEGDIVTTQPTERDLTFYYPPKNLSDLKDLLAKYEEGIYFRFKDKLLHINQSGYVSVHTLSEDFEPIKHLPTLVGNYLTYINLDILSQNKQTIHDGIERPEKFYGGMKYLVTNEPSAPKKYEILKIPINGFSASDLDREIDDENPLILRITPGLEVSRYLFDGNHQVLSGKSIVNASGFLDAGLLKLYLENDVPLPNNISSNFWIEKVLVDDLESDTIVEFKSIEGKITDLLEMVEDEDQSPLNRTIMTVLLKYPDLYFNLVAYKEAS
jgi:hypothetical protein